MTARTILTVTDPFAPELFALKPSYSYEFVVGGLTIVDHDGRPVVVGPIVDRDPFTGTGDGDAWSTDGRRLAVVAVDEYERDEYDELAGTSWYLMTSTPIAHIDLDDIYAARDSFPGAFADGLDAALDLGPMPRVS